MCRTKTYSAETRTGCGAPSQRTQLSSKFLCDLNLCKLSTLPTGWATNSSTLWQPSNARVTGWLRKSRGGGRWFSRDQSHCKIGQQASISGETKLGIDKTCAQQPVVEFGRTLESEQ